MACRSTSVPKSATVPRRPGHFLPVGIRDRGSGIRDRGSGIQSERLRGRSSRAAACRVPCARGLAPECENGAAQRADIARRPPDPRSPIPDPGLNGFIANAPGCHESTTTGEPQRSSPINAARRAVSVDNCSGDGIGRVRSENCTIRAGVGSTATTTRSIAAEGGCDSRSSSSSVRNVRASRIGAGS